MPRCLSDGRYAGLQCHGSICFCMDEEGDEVSGTRVSRHLPLNCTGTNQLPPGNFRFIFSSMPSLDSVRFIIHW